MQGRITDLFGFNHKPAPFLTAPQASRTPHTQAYDRYDPLGQRDSVAQSSALLNGMSSTYPGPCLVGLLISVTGIAEHHLIEHIPVTSRALQLPLQNGEEVLSTYV